jgi:hypothetical protein
MSGLLAQICDEIANSGPQALVIFVVYCWLRETLRGLMGIKKVDHGS